MRPENAARLKKIQRISGILRALCKVSMTAIGLAVLAAVAAVAINRGGSVGYFGSEFPIDQLTARGRFILIAGIAISGGIALKCIFHLHRLLGNYSRAEIFTTGSARQIRQLGITCILWGGLNFFWAFMPLLISTHPPKAFEADLEFVGIGLIILVISWFMEMAVELYEENELTI